MALDVSDKFILVSFQVTFHYDANLFGNWGDGPKSHCFLTLFRAWSLKAWLGDPQTPALLGSSL